jgi:RNA polymerase sigma factor (TIGR02999 family)
MSPIDGPPGLGIPSCEVECLLQAISTGDADSFNQLVSVVYSELRRIARSIMGNHQAGVTLQPTALVNEAYLRLIQGEMNFESRAHFFGAAARAMRQVLVGYARRRNSIKRAGKAQRVTFSDIAVHADEPDLDVLALNEALAALESMDSRLCRLLELRYFGGFGLQEIGELHGQSLAAVKRDWTFARAWLFEYLSR